MKQVRKSMVPTPPVSDMRFVLEEVAGLASIASLPGYELATPDTVAAVLDQAADLARDVLAPLNDSGDREGVAAGERHRAHACRIS